MNKIKTVLMGTPEFAEKIFSKFYSVMQDKFEIITVITAPDKPVGRKQELLLSPVKQWALKNNLNILQPDKIRKSEWIKRIQELNPELIILTAYGQIIPKEILDIPKHGALNIHPSFLPKYRGPSPVQTTILNGDKDAGVTLMLMDQKMDHGDIVSQFEFSISEDITYKVLINKLANIGADLLIKKLPDWIDGKIKDKPQNHSKATFCKIIEKENGKIDWNKSAKEIERQIRAYAIWPNTFTDFNGKKLKILEASPSTALGTSKNTNHKIGEVFLTDNKELAVQTGKGALILKQVQPESKNPMSVLDFRNGHPDVIGSILL
jgi:methionyl-tRNA formyltransferase